MEGDNSPMAQFLPVSGPLIRNSFYSQLPVSLCPHASNPNQTKEASPLACPFLTAITSIGDGDNATTKSEDREVKTRPLDVQRTRYFLDFDKKDSQAQFKQFRMMWHYIDRCQTRLQHQEKLQNPMKTWVSEFDDDLAYKVAWEEWEEVILDHKPQIFDDLGSQTGPLESGYDI